MYSLLQQCACTASNSLLANKVRSFLTMLGIIIGVGAVIVIMSVGAGAQELILSQVKTLGTDLIGILPGGSDKDGPPASVMGIVVTSLTYEDYSALRDKRRVPNLIEVAAYSQGVETVAWGSSSYDANIRGTTASYLIVEKSTIADGRFFTEEEEKNLSRVVVMGHTAKQEIFGDSYAVGQRVRIKKHTFEVIGVMKEKGTVAFQDYDDQVFMPVRTAQRLISGVNHLGFIRAKVDSEESAEQAIEDIKIVLRDRHGISDQSGASDDFTVSSAAEALSMIGTITDALRYFLAAMAALSLLVGGIGIMNIMLISVTERTREIGLRKAVGASNFNLLSQFLMEAVVITLMGGIFGVIFGVIISALIALVANYLGYSWPLIISPLSIILGVSVSALVGIVFGIYPAKKASELEPVEALRYE